MCTDVKAPSSLSVLLDGVPWGCYLSNCSEGERVKAICSSRWMARPCLGRQVSSFLPQPQKGRNVCLLLRSLKHAGIFSPSGLQQEESLPRSLREGTEHSLCSEHLLAPSCRAAKPQALLGTCNRPAHIWMG